MLQEAARREKDMIARIQKEQEANMTEMEKAKDLLKMKTVKIMRAAPSEVAGCKLCLEDGQDVPMPPQLC